MSSQDLREFTINIMSLDNSRHEFDFPIKPDFFEHFPNSLVEKGNGEASLLIDKSETMMHLHFHIAVEVELVCDISLEKFHHPIGMDKEVIIKFGEEDMELSEDVIVIHRESASINVANFIYEFISLEMPMKRIHPNLKDVDRDDWVYTDKSTDDTEEKKKEIDPRWEALKKLKK